MARKNILAGVAPPDGAAAPAPPAGEADGTSGTGPAPRDGFRGNGGRVRVAPDPVRDLACCRLPLTDLGNAERWRARYGRDFRFCPEIGWHHWDGLRWRLLSEEKDALPAELIWSITLTVRAIRNEAALVAASGYEQPLGWTAKELERLEAWADREGATSIELYLKGDEDGARAAWLEGLEQMDAVVGHGAKAALWSQKIAAWAKLSEAAPMVGKIVKWVKGFADVVVRPDAFDADRMAINVLNGTLRLERKSEKRSAADIRAGKSEWKMGPWKLKLHPHDRADLVTKLAPVKYAPQAKCPVYDGFMMWAQPEEAMRRFVHQWGGLSLTGDIGEQKLAFFYGQGGNGKGTWVELLAHIAGDYAGSVGIETFLDNGIKRRGDQATPDIARLPGVRFLRVSEPEKNARLNEGLIKMVTGGDPVDARHLNKGFFSYLPSFKMTISGNHKPKVKDTSKGIWRRMQLVPWNASLTDSEVDLHLVGKLPAEANGVFNRMLTGLLDWRNNGLIVPEEVRDATRAYQDESDQLGRFLHDLCEVGDDPLKVRVNATELWEIFEAWVAATGSGEWKRAGFVNAMREKGFEQKQSNGVWWVKLRLRGGVTLDGVKGGRWPDMDDGGPSAAAAPPSADDPGDAGAWPDDWDD